MICQEDSRDLAYNYIHKVYLQGEDLERDQHREKAHRANSTCSHRTRLIPLARSYDGACEMLSAGEVL